MFYHLLFFLSCQFLTHFHSTTFSLSMHVISLSFFTTSLFIYTFAGVFFFFFFHCYLLALHHGKKLHNTKYFFF